MLSIDPFRLPEVIKIDDTVNYDHLWKRLLLNYEADNIIMNIGKSYIIHLRSKLGTKSHSELGDDVEVTEYQPGCFKDASTGKTKSI